MRRIVFIIFVHVVNLVYCAPTFHGLSTPTNDELSFMKRYGYLPQSDDGLELAYTPQSVSEAVVKLQAFAGIPQTGVIDENTKQLFIRKRCGIQDVYWTNSTRKKRFLITQGWTNKTITFRVLNGSRIIPKTQVEELMASALAEWASYGGLRFVKKDHGPANIEVSFHKEYHGDKFPFDGPGSTLAHAFGPPDGTMHFDDDENWVDHIHKDYNEVGDVTDFYSVAVHEAGHALGLSHSEDDLSVMYPYYQGTDKLGMDDILAMRELYMKENQSSEYTTASSLSPFTTTENNEDTEEGVPDICHCNYDTIQVLQGKIFVFEDVWVWVLERRKVIAEGYPKKYHEVFIGLPKHITLIRAVYEKQDGNIVIFAGRHYWEFNSSFQILNTGDISMYKLPRYVSDLSTVFLSNFNNKTYLIDDERFWRFDERSGTMDKKYPKSMAAWEQVPYPVDAAVIWEGDTYFFQGPRFWRFDNRLVQAHGYYPQQVAPIWFPCEFRTDIPLSHTKNKT